MNAPIIKRQLNCVLSCLLRRKRVTNILSCRSISFGNGMISKDSSNGVSKAVSEAERIVGFPTSYLSLRALLSDELSSVALHMRKLVRTKHPLLKTAREILFDTKHNFQACGLIVLLMAKMIEKSEKLQQAENSSVYNKQRSLAELAELIHTAFLVHRGLVDVKQLSQLQNKNSVSELELGNKIAVLSGDFLMANSCVALSELENSKVVGLISTAISEMSLGLFILPEAGEHSRINSIDSLPITLEQWQNTMYLAHGSLLSNACKSVAILSNQSQEYEDRAVEFSKNLILAQQAYNDIQRITSVNNWNVNGHIQVSSSEICSLPAVLYAQQNGGKTCLEEFFTNSNGNFDLDKNKLRSVVSNDKITIEKSKHVLEKHRNNSMEALKRFPANDARHSLSMIVEAVCGH